MSDLTTRALGECPTWCTVDHTEQQRREAERNMRIYERTGVAPETAYWHTCTVAEIPNPHDSRPVQVGLYRDDDLTAPDEDRVAVSVEHGETLHPDVAAKVAEALVEAVRIATGTCSCGQPLAADGHCSSTDPGQSWRGRPDGSIETTS